MTTTPRKLWIDDWRTPADDGWEIARTGADAMTLLLARTYTVVAFDHDLGDTYYEHRPGEFRELTGQLLLDLLEEQVMTGERPRLTAIHILTDNAGARRAMIQTAQRIADVVTAR